MSTRTPRETYISPTQHGFPRVSSKTQRWRATALFVAVVIAIGIAVALASTLMANAANLPGVVAEAGPSGAAAGKPAAGETGAIDISDPISPFASEHPAVSGLQPDLRDAIQAAATDAAADGISIELTSGWRSADYQARLLDDAIDDYGSESAAREFVSTPEASNHVTGAAVDIARVDPALWLEQYGSAYGLCRVYANESWHFELATVPGGQCPAMLADASETP